MKNAIVRRTIASVTLVLGVLSHDTAGAQDRSSIGAQAVTVTVVNPTGQTVTVYWVDPNGEEQEYATLEPGEEFEVDWNNGVLFRFKVGGRVVASYRTTGSRAQRFIVDTSPTLQPENRSTARETVDTGSAIDANEASALVGYHNKVRQDVKVGPLTWSPQLAAVAQEWANRLAADGTLVHRPKQGRGSSPYGENLAIDSTPLAGAAAWYSERVNYRPGTLVTSANLNDVGHYTQMVWRDTTSVGCGKAIVQRGRYQNQVVLVCNYDPPGNFNDRPPY